MLNCLVPQWVSISAPNIQSELHEEFKKQGDYASLDEIRLKNVIKAKLKELLKKYNDLEGMDKII